MTCPDNTCNYDLLIDTASIVQNANDITIPVNYISTDSNIIGFQFFLKGIPSGVICDQTIGFDTNTGASISGTDIVFNTTVGAAAAGVDFEMHAVYGNGTNPSDGIFIVGHISENTTGALGLPAADPAAALVTFTITDTSGLGHLGGMTISDLYIETSPSYQDTPDNKHPLLVRWPFDVVYSGTSYVSGGTEATYAEWNPDATGDLQIAYADARSLVEANLANSYDRFYNSSNNVDGTWYAKFDSDYDGLINIKDVCTILTEIMVNGSARTAANPGARLLGQVDYSAVGATLKSVRETPNVLAQIVCQDSLDKRSCIPCACPDELELRDDESQNISGLFISDYQVVTDLSLLSSVSSGATHGFVDEDGNFKMSDVQDVISKQKSLPSSTDKTPYGILTISYYSDSNVDGYWLKLGNFRDVKDTKGKSGVTGFLPSTSECDKRKWYQSEGGDPDVDGAKLYKANPKNRPKIHNKIAFGFPSKVFDYIGSEADTVSGRTEGVHSLPKTPGKRSRVLTKLIVNPYSFNGEPTLESFRMVTNDTLVALGIGTYTGDSTIYDGDGLIGTKDLSTVIKYVKLASVTSDAAKTSSADLRTDATQLNAEGDSLHLDIVDILALYNHIIIKGNNIAYDLTQAIKPSDIVTYARPASLTLTATTYSCGHANEGQISLSWTSSTYAEMFTIYRGVEGEYTDQPLWKNFVTSDFMKEQAMAQAGRKIYELPSQNIKFEELVVLTDETTTSFVDLNPPQILTSCSDSNENPQINYIIVASNKHGETISSTTATLPNCAVGPTANQLVLETSINSDLPFSFIGAVTDTNAPPPYGSCTKSTTFCEELTFEIFGDSDKGSFDSNLNKTGEFTYYPPNNEVGIFNVSYRVTDSRGCYAENTIKIKVRPEKILPKVKAAGVGSPEYGKVYLNWEKARGKIAKYEIFRKVSGGAYPGTANAIIEGPYDSSTTTLHYTDAPATPDFCDPAASSISYVYKLVIYGFSGASESSIGGSAVIDVDFVTEESEEVTVAVTALPRPNNPIPTGTPTSVTTTCVDVTHPLVEINWQQATSYGVGTEVGKYEVWRLLPGETTYSRIAVVLASGLANYTYTDNPKHCSDCSGGAPGSYSASYRVTSVDSNGRSGDPNHVSWAAGGAGATGDPCHLYGSNWSATIPCCPETPTGLVKSFDVCEFTSFSGTLEGFVVSGETLTFAEVGGPTAGLSITGATGEFTYNATTKASTDPDVTFDYKVTACGVDSANYTITLKFIDCNCTGAEDDEKSYVLVDTNNLRQEIGLTTATQPPFSLTRRGGQTLRKKSAYVVTSGTNIGCSEDGALLAPLSMSGLSLWLDPSDPATLHLSSGEINRIDDKSGNGHYFKASATINQPGIATIGSVTPLNGIDIIPGGNQKYLLGYDSSDAAISFGSLISPTASTVHTYDFYMVVVPNAIGDVDANPTNNSSIITQYPGVGSGNWWGVFYNSANEFELYQRANPGPVDAPIALTSGGLNSVNVIQFSHNDPNGVSGDVASGNLAAGSLNGGAQSTLTKARLERGIVGAHTLADYQLSVGMDRTINTNFDGQIGEILVFNRVLTTEERAQITTYLVDKWST